MADTEPASMTIRLLCFNAVREALMNVVKYGGTQEVTLDLQREEPDMLRIVVRDRGAGFDPEGEPGGSGLTNFRNGNWAWSGASCGSKALREAEPP